MSTLERILTSKVGYFSDKKHAHTNTHMHAHTHTQTQGFSSIFAGQRSLLTSGRSDELLVGVMVKNRGGVRCVACGRGEESKANSMSNPHTLSAGL